MSKNEFYGVYQKDAKDPSAIFISETDANLYNYVRFASRESVIKVSMIPKHTYGSLPFQEGIAFNRVTRMREKFYQKK